MDPQARPSLFVSARSAPRRLRPRRALRWLVTAAAAVVVLAVVAGGVLYGYAANRMSTRQIDCLDDAVAGCEAGAPAPVDGVRNLLVVGTDSREGLTDEQLRELGTTEVEGPDRADTIMLVHLSPEREDAVVVSFPRDLRVRIPGEGVGKINAARAVGGPELLVRTVEAHTGIPIHHYVEANIAGFLEIVDVLGGVEVCLEEPLVDRAAGADLEAGRQVLVGRDAAAYVRARKADPRGDLGRIERQQRFVRRALAKAASLGTLVNPIKTKRLIDRAAEAVFTDSGFSTADMLRLAWSFKDLDPERITMLTVPSDPGPSFVEPRLEEAEALYQAIREDQPLPAAGTPAAPEASDLRVEVLNGAGTEGLASTAGELLEERGFAVVATGNADGFDHAATEIRHRDGEVAAAQVVAGYFPGAVLTVGDPGDGVDVEVVVGSDFAADPVLATPPPPIAVTATPAPTTTAGGSGACA